MTRAITSDRYSSDFHIITRRLTDRITLATPMPRLIFPCETRKEAEKLRFTWYAFINTLRRENRTEELATLNQYEFIIRGEELILRHRTENPLSKRMMAAAEAQFAATPITYPILPEFTPAQLPSEEPRSIASIIGWRGANAALEDTEHEDGLQ